MAAFGTASDDIAGAPAQQYRDIAAADSAPQRRIPVLKPLLPKAPALLPYLERIDAERTYSNWGPLVTELSERLCRKFGTPRESVVCANSGMSALVGAVLATAGRAAEPRQLAVVPDFTFTATALAVQTCGYRPLVVSCDPKSWTFAPEDLLRQERLLERVGVVMPVAPFGQWIDTAPWLAFQQRTGIPVVIDAAACFDALARQPHPSTGPLPIVLSLHATKAFGCGEGGVVVTTDTGLATRVFETLNFGFQGNRLSSIEGINGKMSEYTAAVALAELDGWDGKHGRLVSMLSDYQHEFTSIRIQNRLWGAPDISCAYVLLECNSAEQSQAVSASLASDGIDTRFWYGAGLREHKIFATAESVDLQPGPPLNPLTLLGLPVAPDLAAGDIRRICSAIRRALG